MTNLYCAANLLFKSGPSAYFESGRYERLKYICISGHKWRIFSDVIGQV